ncbi:MAG: hypothetical protein JXL84_03525 [Deltaproteobacteria bacterium]|nr:hypothetical protein [Deltaproteobacteria bacterium]
MLISLGLLWVYGFGSVVRAEDVKALLREANSELRQAEKDMFAGKSENAVAALKPLKDKVERIKGADPNNPGLKALESKVEKLVRDLEKRTGKDLGGGSVKAAAEGTPPKLPPKPEAKPMPEKTKPASAPVAGAQGDSAAEAKGAQRDPGKPGQAEKLPYHARGPIEEADRSVGRIDGYIQRLSDPNFNKDQLLKNMDAALENARKNLETARAKAAEQGIASHPRFDEVGAKISAAEKRVADAKAGQAKAKETLKAETAEVHADVKAVMDDYNRVKPLFNRATGVVMYYNDLVPVKELLAQVEAFEKTEVGKLKPGLDAFAKKYGNTRDEIDKKAEKMGYSDPYHRASFPYTEILNGMENVRKTRTVMADDLIRRAGEMKGQVSRGIHDFARMQQYGRLREWGRVAAGFEKENPRVQEFNTGLEGWIAEDLKAFNAKIDKATFPGQGKDAPRDAEGLAKASREFLQKEEDERAAKGKEAGKVVAVVVTGAWRVFKHNLLGEPVQYNLPIAAAVQIEKEKGSNLTRVYHGTMLTQEMKGVKQAPPFIGVTVGDSYYIRPSALK